MHIAMFFLAAFASSCAASLNLCGTPGPTEKQVQNTLELQRIEHERFLAVGETKPPSLNFNISVYWHVVMYDDAANGDNLTQATLDNQLQVLNDAYAPYGFSFTEAGADWTTNPDWSVMVSRDPETESEMRIALHQGTYADLNVYFINYAMWVGTATIPDSVDFNSTDFRDDGVIVKASSVPSGTEEGHNMGYAAVHEVGHWLGLFHTFQDGCEGNGDYINDTPAQKFQVFGCQTRSDTCRDQEGLDPVHNYMGYSDDSCYTEFTHDQAARMQTCWLYFRSGYLDDWN